LIDQLTDLYLKGWIRFHDGTFQNSLGTHAQLNLNRWDYTLNGLICRNKPTIGDVPDSLPQCFFHSSLAAVLPMEQNHRWTDCLFARRLNLPFSKLLWL
jgi:hypothetical protein